jgi:hypothetical protein
LKTRSVPFPSLGIGNNMQVFACMSRKKYSLIGKKLRTSGEIVGNRAGIR